MLIRYAPWLKERYQCEVLLAGRPRLRELLSKCKGIDRWIEDPPPDPLPHFDVVAPLMRVPAVLGHTLRDVPRGVPYLTADASLVERWQARLARFKGRKIGIHWRVGHQQGTAVLRNIPLAEFARLAAIRDVQLFSLQKGPAQKKCTVFLKSLTWDRSWMRTPGPSSRPRRCCRISIFSLRPTAPSAMLPGLGLPVWLVLCNPSEWRWGQTGDATVWYPTTRLFRQPTPGDWTGAFDHLVAALPQV